MKKQVLFGLILMITCFIAGGAYIVISINDVTSKLERASSFHRVEFLRNNLVHHIEAVQADLLLQDTPHAKRFQDRIALIEALENSAHVCISCHHTETTREKLDILEVEIDQYMKSLSRTMTLRANKVRMENAQMLAHSQGDLLLNKVKSLSIASSDRIAQRISRIRNDITATNIFLIACLVLGPLTIMFIAIYFLNRFTGSISTLVRATQALEQGDLDYRITDPLKDEFYVLADSFNGMAAALKSERQKFQSILALYEKVFESAGDAIMITILEDEDAGRVISANNAACELYGYPLDEFLGMNIVRLIPPEKIMRFQNKLDAVLEGKWSRQRVRRIKKDGSEIHVDLSMGLLYLEGKKHLLSFSRDISEQLKAEEELNRANQMAVVGQMAAGLAHEIKNPLAGVKVTLDVLASDLELEAEDRELFARTINEINRMERLLKSLLNYARPPQPHFDLTDINRLLDNTIGNIEMTTCTNINAKISFERDFAGNLPQLEVDSEQIQQVFLNILLNAVDAIGLKGTIRTATSEAAAGAVRIEITDDGPGMPEASLEKIFNPFFTTKSKGTGLGLSICRRLVEQHGGRISVASEEGSGTTFVVILPVKQDVQE